MFFLLYTSYHNQESHKDISSHHHELLVDVPSNYFHRQTVGHIYHMDMVFHLYESFYVWLTHEEYMNAIRIWKIQLNKLKS